LLALALAPPPPLDRPGPWRAPKPLGLSPRLPKPPLGLPSNCKKTNKKKQNKKKRGGVSKSE
jgi:hypothetical protein